MEFVPVEVGLETPSSEVEYYIIIVIILVLVYTFATWLV